MPQEKRYNSDGIWLDTGGILPCDWREYINVQRMRIERREKAREAMRKYGLGALICFRETNMKYVGSVPRLSYLSQTESYDDLPSGMRYVLLTENVEKATLFEHGDIGLQVAAHAPWLIVKYAQTPFLRASLGPEANEMLMGRFVEQMKRELKEAGVLHKPVGIDVTAPRLIEALQKADIEATTLGIDALADAREIKTRDEIECIRMACAIGEAALWRVKQAIRPGVRESDLVKIVNETAYELGGTTHGDTFVAASGPNSWPNFRTFTDRMIRPGDVVFVDVFGIRFMEYHGCYYRTFVCGKAWPEIREAFRKVAKWQREPLDLGCKDGNTTKDIAMHFPSAEEWGREEEAAASGNAICHGIGLSHFERPLISREWSLDHPIPLKEGQVIAIESQCGDGLGQGVRLEDIIVVTKNGYELLTRWPIDDIIECPY
jgi:Xaa-Pro dipeptidase